MKTLLNPGDEVLTFAPYFGEYRAYVTNYDGILKKWSRIPKLPAKPEKFEQMLSERQSSHRQYTEQSDRSCLF